MSKRSDLKENILANKLEKPLKWAVENRATVLGAIGLLVIAGLISSVFIIRKKELREMNWTRLAQAKAMLSQPQQRPQAKPILSEIRTASPADAVGLHALFTLGEAALLERNFDEAVTRFSELVGLSGAHPLTPLALSNLGHAYEQKKDYNAAAQAYQKFMESFGEHFMAARIQLSLGRALSNAGRVEEAAKTLEQLIDLYPTSEWAEKARRMMDKNKTR